MRPGAQSIAAFIGFEVIRRVSPLLHTPLMSLTNALDAIAVVGAIILAGAFMGSISVFQYLTNTFDNAYFGFGNWITEVAGQVERSRIAGPFSNPNAYAQTLVVVVPLALDQLWHEHRSLLRLLAAWALAVSVISTWIHLPLSAPSSAACFSSNASEMYLRKMRPRTTCLYSAASMFDRSLSAASQSLASKPRLAEEEAF